MKKSALIICIILSTFILTAFAYSNWSNVQTYQEELSSNPTGDFENVVVKLMKKKNEVDFVYQLDSRFQNVITKEDLDKAITILDIVPNKRSLSLESFRDVKVSILYDDKEIAEMGANEVLTTAQLELLKSTDYSSNFYINAKCKNRIVEPNARVNYELVYYMSVVPEKTAEFKYGNQALIDYLKENSKKVSSNVTKNQLKPGKVSFVVTKTGRIEDVKLNSTSGYKSIDNKMLKLIRDMPGDWIPARNSKGEMVDQGLVFSFGIVGC